MGNRVTIITGQHLIFNPRVWKEANALSESGYNVAIFTTWYSSRYRQEDEALLNSSIAYLPCFSLINSGKNTLSIFYARALKKIANLVFVIFKISSVYQLLYMPKRQLKSILSRPTDLFICHQEAGLLIGKELLKLNYKVAFDFEDWYSEDYITSERPLKLLRKAELKAIRNCAYATCPSYSMAAVLDQKYNAKKQIQVIYNTFQNSEESSSEHYKIKNSIVWFSQTIGPDRGLESFLKSVKDFILPLEIHLVGACTSSYKNYLDELVKSSRHVLIIHPLMKHSSLMKFLRKFKVGLALENNFPQNKNLTISNKILTYLQLNLHVIATATFGQLELSEDFKSKITYVDLANSQQTQDKITRALNDVDLASTPIFPYKYTWNAQKGKILDFVRESVLD